MINFFEYIRNNSSFTKLSSNELLYAEYKCPIKESKVAIWSEANYLAYVLSGKKVWSTNEASYELKEGECILVAKGAHYIEQIRDREFCVLIFFLPDEFIEEALEEAQYGQKKSGGADEKFIVVDVNDPLQLYFQSMASLFTQKISPTRQLLNLKFKELILQLLNYQGSRTLDNFFSSITLSPERKFKQLIESNLKFDLGIEEYAQLANMSVATFKRYFKQIFKDSPGQYIIHRRLSFASMLLKKSNKSVQEVAFESGFESAAHFTRMFTAKFKVAPSKFRSGL